MVRKNSTEKELEEIGIVNEKPKTEYLDKTGKVCNENFGIIKIVGFKNSKTYYIKYRRGELFDPYGMDERKAQASDTKYKKVDEEIFKSYLKYLSSRRYVYLSEARRSFINKGF